MLDNLVYLFFCSQFSHFSIVELVPLNLFAIVKNQGKTFAIVSKSVKNNNYRYRDYWKSKNYIGSNTEKKQINIPKI